VRHVQFFNSLKVLIVSLFCKQNARLGPIPKGSFSCDQLKNKSLGKVPIYGKKENASFLFEKIIVKGRFQPIFIKGTSLFPGNGSIEQRPFNT